MSKVTQGLPGDGKGVDASSEVASGQVTPIASDNSESQQICSGASGDTESSGESASLLQQRKKPGKDLAEKSQTSTQKSSSKGGSNPSYKPPAERSKPQGDSETPLPSSEKLAENGSKQNTNDAGLQSSSKSVSVNEGTKLLEKWPVRDVSNVKTYMNLFKALTGPSTIGMPRVIANGGLVTGTFGFLLIGFLNAYCNITMVRCSRMLGERTHRSWLHYEEVVEGSFATISDDVKWQKRATRARQGALWMLVIIQLGLLSFYIQIIATTLKKELEYTYPDVHISLLVAEIVVSVFLLPYSWLRNLRVLASFSTLANVFNVVCAIVVIQYACTHLQPISSVDLIPSDLWTVPLFIGGAVFTAEGIALVLPIENRALHPEAYTGACGIISLATATNITLNLLVGVFGYLAFGNSVSGNLLVSLPHMWIYRLVAIMYALMVFFSYTLQLYQPAEAIYDWLSATYRTDFVTNYGNVLVRSIILASSFLLAAVVPRPDLLMSLTGAVAATVLVFIFPPIAEMLLLRSSSDGTPWRVWIMNSIVLIFGAVAFFTGTYTSIRDIVQA